MTRRITQLLIGLFLYGIGIALIVRAEIGVAPWDVLTQGIDNHTGLGFGLITVLVSGVVLLFWIPIRQKPGVGTVLNAFLVGPSADVGLWLIPEGLDLWLRIILFAAGLLILAIATGLYIGAHFGPGPRDGLMTGLHKTTGQKIWVVRTAIEVVVLAIGWALGGNVGIGTVLFAVLVGPLCNWTMPLFAIKRPAFPIEPSSPVELAREAKLEGSAAPSAPIIDSPAN
ncbi:YczE/YyaS/YitT family protein [Glaciibacter superstes]|uniref:membrane protein YczE n=1 Tax=Glaciibacter superstes TaxID=501023 RepID=UPI0003B59B2B|nr:membrane protein [Glaciibacter superstes]